MVVGQAATDTRVTRRRALRIAAEATVLAGCAAGRLPASLAQEPQSLKQVPRSELGLVIYCQRFRREHYQNSGSGDLYEPLTFLQHCQQMGAGGMQAKLGTLSPDKIKAIRDYAEEHNLFVDAIISLPSNDAESQRFEAEVRTAAEVGVQAARTVIMPGRRYERFASLPEARKFEALGKRMLQRAAPIVEKYRVPLAVENHKDQRIADRVALLESLDSEYVGACVDTGNSFALLDDPYEAVAALAPYAFTVHLKDQALQHYERGFLLGDVALGDGCFDLQRMVASLKQSRPTIHFALELITRDALQVPCLTESYWDTMPEVSGADLARTLRLVRGCDAEVPTGISELPLDRQVALEEANVRSSLAYARDQLVL